MFWANFQTGFNPQRWMFATLAWKHYLREPCLLERTTELHLRTTNSRLPALYFLNQIPSGLPLSPPFPVFLSKMDVFAQRDYNEQGIKQKDAAIFPPPPPPPPTYHPFISPSIFPSSAIYGKFFTLPSRLPPSFSPLILLSLCFSWKVSNMQWRSCHLYVKILLQPNSPSVVNLVTITQSKCIHKKDLFVRLLHSFFIYALKYLCHL